MRNNKKLIKLIAGASCLVLALSISSKIRKSQQVELLTPAEYMESLKRRPASAKPVMSWDKTKEKLNQAGKLPKQARLDLFHETLDGTKSNPNQLHEFIQWVQTNVNDLHKSSLGISTLATIGTTDTQCVLVKLYHHFVSTPGQDKLGNMVLVAMARSESKLSKDTRDFLHTIISSHANPSMTANAADAVASAIQKDPTSISNANDVNTLSELAKETSSSSEKLALINAMGKSRNPGFIPVLSDNVVSVDPMIREKAVFALRNMKDKRLTHLFKESMNDTDVNVQIAVVKAIRHQQNQQTYTDMLTSCANNAQDAELKNLCSQTMANTDTSHSEQTD